MFFGLGAAELLLFYRPISATGPMPLEGNFHGVTWRQFPFYTVEASKQYYLDQNISETVGDSLRAH